MVPDHKHIYTKYMYIHNICDKNVLIYDILIYMFLNIVYEHFSLFLKLENKFDI